MTNSTDQVNTVVMPGFLYGDGSYETPSIQSGLTKREYFAAMAMQGLMANSSVSKSVIAFVKSGKYNVKFGSEVYAEMAVQAADELIKTLNS